MRFQFISNRKLYALILELAKEIKQMSTGLTSLQQADQDLASAVLQNTQAEQAIVAELKDLSDKLNSINSEDPAIQNIAADLQDKIKVLQSNTTAMAAAVAPPTPPAA